MLNIYKSKSKETKSWVHVSKTQTKYLVKGRLCVSMYISYTYVVCIHKYILYIC